MRARSLGAVFIKEEAVEMLTSGHKASGVKLASGSCLTTKIVINCAGAWAAQIAETAGVRIPVIPIKRQIFALEPAVQSEKPLINSSSIGSLLSHRDRQSSHFEQVDGRGSGWIRNCMGWQEVYEDLMAGACEFRSIL